jgi:ribosome assembly protein 4
MTSSESPNPAVETTVAGGGIAWAGSLVGSRNPQAPLGYRYNTVHKRYKYNDDASNNLNAARELPENIQIRFRNRQGVELPETYDIPVNSTVQDLQVLLQELMSQQGTAAEDARIPYAFYVALEKEEVELSTALQELLLSHTQISTETVLHITYQPLSIFRVRPVSRCTDTLTGHTAAILHVSFAPHGKFLASGGGDTMVRFWDTFTATTKFTCAGHKDHVLCTRWSPDGQRFASGDKRGVLIVWDPLTGKVHGKHIKAHAKWISDLAWEPLHLCSASVQSSSNNETSNSKFVICERLATASRDGTVKLWNTRTGNAIRTLSGHADSVEAVKWTGEAMIVSCSRDRTIKVWNPDRGILVRTLTGHGHRVNTLALSSDTICRCGPFDFKNTVFPSPEEMIRVAKEKYDAYRKDHGPDTLVSGSDDFTLYVWNLETSKHPVKRLTGHQQAVNFISYSPDGRYFASASFDKKVKVWNGHTGDFLYTLTGHVGAVYQVAWSADSRYLVSASKDSTAKLWDIASGNGKAARETLPGHADEVYALDWSPISGAVATGSKDRTIKIWKH